MAKVIRTVYITLLSIAGLLAVVIIIGTITGLTRGKNVVIEQRAPVTEDDIRVFSGLRRLRIPLVNSSVLVLSIAFPYQASDVPFTEELAGKIGEFRTIATDYFSSLPPSQIISIDEEAAKTEILRRYNSILRLGRISVLYFSDMMIMDSHYQ